MRPVLSILAAGVLILLAAVLVLPACGVRFVVGQSMLWACPAPETRQSTDALDLLHERQRSLFTELRSLERDLGLPSCEPERPAPPPIEPDPPPIEPDPPPIEPDIDPDAWNNQDIRLLDGCWILDGEEYVAIEPDTRVETRFTEWEMCFDANGRGEQTLRGRDDGPLDSVRCNGRTQAVFDGQGRLVIWDPAKVQCDDNSYIHRRVITCELVEDTAQCSSVQPGSPDPSHTGQVRLKRK